MSGSTKSQGVTGKLLTVEECAELGAVAVVSIRRAIRRGELQAVRIGHLLRVPLSAWQGFLDSNRVTGRPVAVPAKKKAAAAANLPPARSA